MIRVAVCDDTKEECHKMVEFIKQYAILHNMDMHVDEYYKGEDLVGRTSEAYDIFFLDIKLGDLDGIRTARIIRERNLFASIVFVTYYHQYAMEGYRVDACGYIVKPLDYDRMEEVISQAIQRMRKRMSQIMIHYHGRKHPYPIGSLLYVEVFSHKLIFHFNDGTQVRGVGSLKEVLEQDKDSYLIQIHKSCIINQLWVEYYERNHHMVYLKGKKTGIKVSRHRWDEFVKRYLMFYGNIYGEGEVL